MNSAPYARTPEGWDGLPMPKKMVYRYQIDESLIFIVSHSTGCMWAGVPSLHACIFKCGPCGAPSFKLTLKPGKHPAVYDLKGRARANYILAAVSFRGCMLRGNCQPARPKKKKKKRTEKNRKYIIIGLVNSLVSTLRLVVILCLSDWFPWIRSCMHSHVFMHPNMHLSNVHNAPKVYCSPMLRSNIHPLIITFFRKGRHDLRFRPVKESKNQHNCDPSSCFFPQIGIPRLYIG